MKGPIAIDTDVFSWLHLQRGRHADYAPLVRGHQLALPFPVVGELQVLALRAGWGPVRCQALHSAIAACVVIPSDARIVARWAEMRARFISRLKGEGINDLWIAACCLVHDLPIATGNLNDFGTIAGEFPLRVIVPTADSG